MLSTRLILACILITLLTIISIVNCRYTTLASQTSVTRPQANSHKVQVIGGRWQLVQASLGMQLLPDTLSLPSDIAAPYPPSRIGFRRKKRTPIAPLHFAHDALRVPPKHTLKELVVSLRRISHEDAKMETFRSDNRRGRARLGRSPTTIRKRQVSESTPR